MRDYKTQAERYRTGAPPDLWNKPSTYWKGGGKPKIMQADFETYGEVDLPHCGNYRYIEDESFEPLLLAFAFDDEEVFIIDLACGEDVPDIVWASIYDDQIIKSAWNAQFERTVFGRMTGHTLNPDSWRCSMVWAAEISLPLKLKQAAEVLKTGQQKDDAGERLIRYFSVPCKPTKANGGRTRNLPEHAPEDWEKFKSYCLQDVRTERDIRHRLEQYSIPAAEWNYYHMDQRINDRGVLIDRTLVSQAISFDGILTDEMTRQACNLTGLDNPNSVAQLKGWLKEKGVSVDTLGKKDVAVLLKKLETGDKDSSDALELLKLRQLMAKSSVKKYQAAERCICSDGRVHGLFQFSGANRTARWAGRLLQMQNLPQNHIPTLFEVRDMVKNGDFDLIEALYESPPDILSQLIRTMLIPKPGCEFIVADFSAIEARVLAWEAGEEWVLDAFRNGQDLYCATASQMFGVPVVKHGVNGDLRQKGKIATLACIAEGQMVKTSRGWWPIEKVRPDDLVWDGCEWVFHGGLIYRGFRHCISYRGLIATPDHIICTSRGLVPFGAMAGPDAIPVGKRHVYDLVNAGPRHRYQVNGFLVHNCGYGGSVGALTAMGALDMGLKKEELPDIITSWRKANPKIVQYWWDIEKAAVDTVKDHQDRTVGRVGFQFYGNILWLILPSGRKLAYINPRLEPSEKSGRMSITFKGIDTANKWNRIETYSGKLVENLTQASARDILAEAMWRLERVGLNIVGHVHDEVLIEAPKGSVSVDEVCNIMSENPSWAEGLPLAAAGYLAPEFYFKD